MTEIIVSVSTGILTLIGVCVTAYASAKSTRTAVTAKLETAQAVTDTKIEELTREVRAHNNFAQRIPVLEVRLTAAERLLQSVREASGN